MNKTSISLRRYSRFATIAVAAAFLFSACNKIKDDGNSSTNNAAGLMAFNLAAGSSPVFFTLSGNGLTNVPLGFNSYTGNYLSIFPGLREAKAYVSNDSSVTASTYNFELSNYYSLFLVANNGVYENVIVKDNLDSLVANGKALVRYINAIPEAASPTVTITGGGATAVSEVALYKHVSGFVPVNPGAVTIAVSNGSTINTSRTITLEAQKVYTVLLSGLPTGTGDNAVQVKYILNGTVDDTAGRVAGAATGTLQ